MELSALVPDCSSSTSSSDTEIMMRYMLSKWYAGVRRFGILAGVVGIGALSACSLDNIVNVDDPEGGEEIERDGLISYQNARGLYHSALGQLSQGLSGVSASVAIFTDELTSRPATSPEGAISAIELDARVESRPSNRVALLFPGQRLFTHNAPYNFQTPLHGVRTSASQTRDILRRLDDSEWDYMISASYALEAYAVLGLAENVCSGFPLTQVPFEGVVQFDSGTTTLDAFAYAVALFDSALAITHDSARFINLARIGKGRAYLGLGRLDSAALSVDEVPDNFTFNLTYTENSRPGQSGTSDAFWTFISPIGRPVANSVELSNNEGVNGLVWYNSDSLLQDRRVPARYDISGGFPRVQQQKFVGGSISFPLARSIEVKLIRAEYLLSTGDAGWMNEINEARRTIALADTVDPGTAAGRRDLLFRERAYWFFLEGTRLADYRRLVRYYGESPDNVYPRGVYRKSRGEAPFYGSAMVFTPPGSEYEDNHLYRGCHHFNP